MERLEWNNSTRIRTEDYKRMCLKSRQHQRIQTRPIVIIDPQYSVSVTNEHGNHDYKPTAGQTQDRNLMNTQQVSRMVKPLHLVPRKITPIRQTRPVKHDRQVSLVERMTPREKCLFIRILNRLGSRESATVMRTTNVNMN